MRMPLIFWLRFQGHSANVALKRITGAAMKKYLVTLTFETLPTINTYVAMVSNCRIKALVKVVATSSIGIYPVKKTATSVPTGKVL
jgi:hypothetical protein